MKPRVFVSSVMDGFKECRQATRKAVIAAGGDPLLIEDFPSLNVSSRTACLDGVKDSDIFVLVVGDRGGWIAPSGKFVIEEEYEEAKRRKLPILIFVQNVSRDAPSENLVERISNYVSGHFRKTFNSSNDLEKIIESSLNPLIQHFGRPKMDLKEIENKFGKPSKIYGETILRFILFPEREDEIFDPVTMESDSFKQEIYEIGHSQDVGLLSYSEGKSFEVEVDKIVILQGEDRGHRGKRDFIRLEIHNTGSIIVDTNVTGKRDSNLSASLDFMVILEDDIFLALKRCFLFAGNFFDKKDTFKRYDQMYFNVILDEIGYKQLAKELPRGSSIGMSMRDNTPIKVFDNPRLVNRFDLKSPEKEIEVVISLFRRKLKK